MILPEAGAKIGGKYSLLEKMSEGGGGVVWRAKDPKGRESALKILKLPPLRSKEALTDRFKREFELFKKVSHPNIAKIYDFGFDSDNDIYYFTSELLTGGDLRKMIGKPIAVIEQLLLQSLRALEYLRNFGILHLDIKPQNLLLRTTSTEEKPDLALIDFGLAGFNPPDRPGGTPNYMPPEIVLKRLSSPSALPIDHRSDLYSLGVTFYYVLCGIQPFAVSGKDGHLDTDATMKGHIKDERPSPPSFHNPEVPPYLDAVIMRMMAKNPDDRYQSAILAAQALCFRSPNRLEPESRETISAYLPEEGMLIGRHEEKKILEKLITETAKGENQGLPVVCIVGAWGTGKTRLLQSLKPFAQQQEMEVVTDLRNRNPDLKRATAFLVDDPFLPQSTIDIASLPDIYALRHLVRYILQMPKARYFLAVTLNPDLMPLNDMLRQMEIDPSLCTIVNLKNFTVAEISEYLTHLLGEAPSLNIVEELHQATFGNPRFIVDFFKRMMKRGEFFSYFTGRPGAATLDEMGFSFSHVASPPSLAEYILGLVKELPRGAKILAHRLACWQRPAGIDELEDIGKGETTDNDFTTLLSSGLVKRNEKGMFSFANPVASRVIEGRLDSGERSSIHDLIAAVIAGKENQSPEETRFEMDRHLVFGSDAKLQREAAPRLAIESLKRLHPAETSELLHTVFNALPADDWETRAEVLVRESQAMARIGRWDDAKANFEKLRTLVPPLCPPKAGPPLADKGREGGVDPQFVLNLRADEQLGLLALRRRALTEAREIFTKALNSMRQKKLPKTPEYDIQMIRLENYLAGVNLREGKYEAAADIYTRTAKLVSKFPENYQLQITNNELGETYVLLGRNREAIEILERELEWAKKADHRERIVNRLRILGDAQRRMENFPVALEHYQSALDFSRKYNLFEHQLRIRNSFANLLLQMGKLSEAVEQYKPALDLAMQLEGKATCVDIMANIGSTYNKLGQFDDAIEYLELALDFAKGPEAESSAQVKIIMPSIHVALGHAHYERKQLDEAEEHLNIALKYESDGSLNKIMLYNLHGTLAEIALARGAPADAKKRVEILEKLAAEIPEAKTHLEGLKKQIEDALKKS